MSRSFKVDGIQMPLWGIAWLTCMQNVGAWSRLGECSTRCHHVMWSPGMPYLDDVKCMGMERKLKLFEQMCAEGVKPDDITFVCLLSACSHAGLVDEGMCCYASMVTDYMISAKLEHYTCMVDLLGHAGHLQEAENMVMEVPCKPHVAAWMALLGACRICGNVEMAEHVAKRILEMKPNNAAGYVLLSNIYAATGNRLLCENVEWQRKEKGVKKQQDCTWIEMNNEVHTFVVGDVLLCFNENSLYDFCRVRTFHLHD